FVARAQEVGWRQAVRNRDRPFGDYGERGSGGGGGRGAGGGARARGGGAERYAPRTMDVDRDEAVTITFHDGHVARFDLLTLRLNCPCATCRGLRDRGE